MVDNDEVATFSFHFRENYTAYNERRSKVVGNPLKLQRWLGRVLPVPEPHG